MTIQLEGEGTNPHWNVHRSLEILQGLQNSAVVLIQQMDEHIRQRDSGGGKHANMMGNAVAAVILTSYAAEIALKTLHAQSKPNKRPPRGHDLLKLFDGLDTQIKLEAQQILRTRPPLGAQNWIGESPEIRALIQQGSSNFSDWRYVAEKPGMGGGVPKVMVNIIQAVQELTLRYVLANEETKQ